MVEPAWGTSFPDGLWQRCLTFELGTHKGGTGIRARGTDITSPGSQASESAAGHPHQGHLAPLGQGLWWPLPWVCADSAKQGECPSGHFLLFNCERAPQLVIAK